MARGRHPSRYARAGGQRAAEELRALFEGVGSGVWWHVVDDTNTGLGSFKVRRDAEEFASQKRDELRRTVWLVRHESGKAGVAEKVFTFPASNPARRKPTRKAQAFIGRKIRTLAHEGMRAPRRIAAAYSMARRAGFKVPRRRGTRRVSQRNPKGLGERQAWQHVRMYAEAILSHKATPTIHRRAEEIRQWAEMMLEQLERGIHENPTLAVLGNPPAKVVGTLSNRLYEVRYLHKGEGRGSEAERRQVRGKPFYHTFTPGSKVLLLEDGSVWIKHPTKRLWEDHQ
jgi:hypothetical protein